MNVISTERHDASATQLNSAVTFRGELERGHRELSARFRCSPARLLSPDKLLEPTADIIYRLRAGWACQFRDLGKSRGAIIDIYLPGDILGLDMDRPLNKVLTLTSVTVEKIQAENALVDLMTSRHTALYICWLLSQRQRRADRRLIAMSCLDARGRLANMVFDFYTRLRRRKLVAALNFNLPLTQLQIGNYLGLTEVHVNRVLRSLRDERTIEMEKHCVTILDLERLQSLVQPGPTRGAMGDARTDPISAAAD